MAECPWCCGRWWHAVDRIVTAKPCARCKRFALGPWLASPEVPVEFVRAVDVSPVALSLVSVEGSYG